MRTLIVVSAIAAVLLIVGCAGEPSNGANEPADDDTDDDATDDDTDIEPSEPDATPPPDCEEGMTYDEPYPEITRGPYLQMVEPNSIHIVWYTDRAANSVVRYGIGGTPLSYCDFKPVERHEVVLTGLLPYREYTYLVRSDGAQSEEYTFKTALELFSRDSFRFGAYGDNRTYPENHAAVAEGLHAEDPDFFFNVGDVVTDGNVLEQYNSEFFEPAHDLVANAPFYVSIGNHERESAYYYEIFSLPGNEMWYSFTYGNAIFIALDTNKLYLPTTPQYEWFKQELQRANKLGFEWKFVFAHHPAYCEGWEGYDGELLVRMLLLPLMRQYGVDIYFCGHTHDYERGDLGGVVQILTGGGGGGLDSWQRDFDFITVYESAYHYVIVDVEDKLLTLQACYPDGECFDEMTLAH